jgi:hypothetical protein
MLDDLGELYLEAVDVQRFGNDDRSVMRSERDELIREMRDSLRRRTGIRALTGYPRATALVMLGLFGSFIVTGIISANNPRDFARDLFFLPYPHTFVSVLPFLFLSLFAVGGYLCVMVWSSDRLRRRRHLGRLREKIRPRGESSLISRYPQAR